MRQKLFILLMAVLFLLTLPPACGKKKAKKTPISKPNILLITIDTLRRDYLGYYGYPLDTSPFIDQMAREGLVYKNTITPLPLTDGSHASILTALHPLTHNVIRNASELDENAETIAEVLKDNGYHTIGTVAVHHLAARFQFAQGFDSYSDSWNPKDPDIKHNSDWMRVGQSVNQSLFQQIDQYLAQHPPEQQPENPFFIWVHYYDPHVPYVDWPHIDLKPPKKLKKRVLKMKYAKEIRYTDDHIRALYRHLEQNGLTQNLVTCITADHGEQLGDHGHMAQHVDIYSETTHVPLLFHGPGIPRGHTVQDTVSTMDIAPTLLALAGLHFQQPVHGTNLLTKKTIPQRDFLVIGDPTFVRAVQLIRHPFAYILNFDFMYKYFYISTQPDVSTHFPAHRLQPVPQGAIHTQHFKKSDKYGIEIHYPDTPRKGLYYGIMHFKVTNAPRIFAGYRVDPGGIQTGHGFQNPGTITVCFPVTPLDHPVGLIRKKKDTHIENLQYALIPATEFHPPQNKIPGQKKLTQLENTIFTYLKSPRKHHRNDEMYHLDQDPKMRRNRHDPKGDPRQRLEWQKTIYQLIKRYQKDQPQIRGKGGKGKPLSPKDREMLKSLGYLE